MTDEERQTADDRIQVLLEQRNSHENRCVSLVCEIKARDRQIEALEAKLKSLAEDKTGDFPRANGHAKDEERPQVQ